MKKTITLFFVICASILFGCKKVDFRDEYVGEWKFKDTGFITIYQFGNAIQTAPTETQEGFVEINKHGDKDITIDSEVFYINGNSISADPRAETVTSNNVVFVGTAIYTGNISNNLINIYINSNGSWSNSNGANGNYSITRTAVFTK